MSWTHFLMSFISLLYKNLYLLYCFFTLFIETKKRLKSLISSLSIFFAVVDYLSLCSNPSRGGILLYVREVFIALTLRTSNIKTMFFELSLTSKKWLLCCTYNPPQGVFIREHLKELIKAIQFYSKNSDSFTFMGNYNAQVTETSMASFDERYELKNFIKKPTCYKKPTKSIMYRSIS